VILPPAANVQCGGYCCAHRRNDVGTGGGREDTACLGWGCCCDSPEHCEGLCVRFGRLVEWWVEWLVDGCQCEWWVAEGCVEAGEW
jgi:hypothetical protein